MVQATEFEFRLWKFISDYCFTTYMISLKASNSRDIRIEAAKRSIVWKYTARVIMVALFATKLLHLVHRATRPDVSAYFFFHSHILLYVVTGLICATAFIIMSNEALTFFNFQHAVCQKFLGKLIFRTLY